jgi:hypothetical protein
VALTQRLAQCDKGKAASFGSGFFVAPQSFHRADILRDGMIRFVWG